MADVTQSHGLPLLSDYGAFARRNAWVLTACIAVGLLVGITLALRAPSHFSATASIALTPVPMYVTVPSELLAPEVSIDTDAQLLQSPQVVDAIATKLDIDPILVEDRVSVTASPNSNVLHVTVTSASPVRAANAANAAVAALEDALRQSLGALRDDQINQVRIMLADREDTLSRTQSRRLVIPETEDLFGEILTLRDSLDELEEAQEQPARLVDAALPPKRPDYANTEIPLISGLMLGLLVGCLGGAARDRGLLRLPARSIRLEIRPVRQTAG